MPESTILSLGAVRTDGWFERVGQTVSSFRALCDILGERFFAFSLITGARITALTVDRRNPENTLVDFVVGPADTSEEEAERLPLGEFQRRLVAALVLDTTYGPVPTDPEDTNSIQQFIGPAYLLLAPLYQLQVDELVLSGSEATLGLSHQGGSESLPLDQFREALRQRVREELDQVAHSERRSAIDLGQIAKAEELYETEDYSGIKELLGTWPAALTIYLRTPEAQTLTAETRGQLAHALGLLGSSCSALGEGSQAEEILRLAVQYAGDGEAAADIYERLGEALLAERRVGEAIGPLRRAAALGYVGAWPRLARAFLARERYLAALGAVAEARTAGLEDPDLKDIGATAEARLGPAAALWRDLAEGISP